ncbi:MAG: SPOR domain-containing protein [Synergistaceae bacterium]|nr:SPOR domain-containing protein [Synergistaceae bacterium]MBR0035167.1 SPOR domain-containing protein [Synergistaceae bacterium]
MTSQHISERQPETDRRSRFRRGIKKRGILPSFGDLVLPIVSIAAVGLLVLAGRQFFINGLQTSPEITSTRAYADSPALLAEREREEAAENPIAPAVKDVPPITAPAKGITVTAENTPAVKPAQTLPKTPAPAPAKPAIAAAQPSTPAPKAAPVQKAEPEKPKPAPKVEQLPANKQWRVQVGAYPSKASAETAAKKIRNAGYKAVVYKNPDSKYVKVWVEEAGPTKFYADRIADQMKKLGFKTSFAFPPASK